MLHAGKNQASVYYFVISSFSGHNFVIKDINWFQLSNALFFLQSVSNSRHLLYLRLLGQDLGSELHEEEASYEPENILDLVQRVPSPAQHLHLCTGIGSRCLFFNPYSGI